MKIFHGTAASPGIAQGNAYIIGHKKTHTIPQMEIAESERESGWNRFEKSVASISEYYKNLIDSSNKEQEKVVQTYLLMLSDVEFIKKIKSDYEKSNFNLEYIIKKNVDESANILRSLDDEYLRERAYDIEDVFEKVVFHMLGYSQTGIENIPDGVVVIAENLTPSQSMSVFKKNIKALITQEGGISSHISILARTYGVPAIFGIKDPCTMTKNGQLVIVDAVKLCVIVEPDEKIQSEYKIKLKDEEKKKLELLSFIKQKPRTKDGKRIKVFANIGSVEEAKIAKSEGADGIGLFRTEFLFMNEKGSKISGEEEHFKAYSQVLSIMGSKSVTIRTLDVGGDKIINDIGSDEKNPLLGCRAIRFCLNHREIFKTQLRSLYRASVYGNLRILLPLITSVEQIIETKKIIEQVKQELTGEGIAFAKNIPLGVMIETPAAAVCSDLLAKECSFFSVGSNDLTQYILAVDRENTNVSGMYDELHPAIIRMIKHTLISSQREHIDLSVCGEMASREETLKILIGLGVRNLSVGSKSISEVKKILSKNSLTEMKELVKSDYLWCGKTRKR
ncbi:MAG: phosphoenolpyruvate--protein phosphotransferase [Treponemataceae bacterium]